MIKKLIIQKMFIFIISLLIVSFFFQVIVASEEKEPFTVWDIALGNGDVNQIKSIIQIIDH